MKYIGAAVTDVGIKKKTNQDSVCIRIANTEHHGEIVMAVLCDGMGGLEKGELASAAVIRAYCKWFEEEFPKSLNPYAWGALSEEWKKIAREQNLKIKEYGKKINVSLGTTLSAMLIIENSYMIIHVGDSRIYRIRDNKIEQLTKDQTFVEREVMRGNMTEEEAKTDSRNNVLLQCIGASRTVEPDIIYGQIRAGTVYLLCSDGFRHKISEAEMYERFCFQQTASEEQMATNGRRLIEIIKNREEKDNITVAAIRCAE